MAGGATALFLATLGAVVAWGRQPPAPAREGTTTPQQVVPSSPPDPGYYDGGYDGSGSYDGGGAAPAPSQQPAPATTRQS